MSGDKKPPIIKKVIKKGHGGHHGGSWKVAYADFVTAMMAFFLVMWLLAISSESGREALADYFNELTLTDAIFNGGQPTVFDASGSGQRPSILEGGCFSPQTKGDATINSQVDNATLQAQMAALLETTQTLAENLESLPEGVDGGEGSGDAGRSDGAPLTGAEQQFSDSLVSDIQGNLGDAAAGQVTVEKVRGGLRIQIVDKEGRPMFASGGPTLTDEAREILSIVGQRLAGITHKISIEGHTDALTFAGQRITNWELSTARASAARIYLSRTGVADSRVVTVAGYAATQPLP
ncbi:MAG: OmpA family protein, partial [Candidatus Adiutrix sp.]|nr:OmpA family protein [Candidatus Adiutrix sp.]